jgi:hypothetical protein
MHHPLARDDACGRRRRWRVVLIDEGHGCLLQSMRRRRRRVRPRGGGRGGVGEARDRGDDRQEVPGANFPSTAARTGCSRYSPATAGGRLLLVTRHRLFVMWRPTCSGVIPSLALRGWHATRRTRQCEGGCCGMGVHGVMRGSHMLHHLGDLRHGLSLPV